VLSLGGVIEARSLRIAGNTVPTQHGMPVAPLFDAGDGSVDGDDLGEVPAADGPDRQGFGRVAGRARPGFSPGFSCLRHRSSAHAPRPRQKTDPNQIKNRIPMPD
jgi:hypothetical protein